MILILMGVSGSGKTEVGLRLADRLGWPFFDGDHFHPPENVDKMSRGVPLTEADREPWLQALRRLLLDLEARGQSGLLACSALTAAFREALTEGVETAQFVHLAGSFDLILDRIKARAGHYMKAEMLASQFEALEPPDHVLTVPVDQPPEAIAGQIVDALGLEAT